MSEKRSIGNVTLSTKKRVSEAMSRKWLRSMRLRQSAESGSAELAMSERELARIIQQMQDRLDRKDAILSEAARVLRVVADNEPIHNSGQFAGLCVYCETLDAHDGNCPWLQAKYLLDKCPQD